MSGIKQITKDIKNIEFNKVMKSTVHRRVYQTWNLNLLTKSELSFIFNIITHPAKIKGIINIKLFKINNNVPISNIDLKNNTINYNNKYILDVGKYFFQITYSISTFISYKFITTVKEILTQQIISIIPIKKYALIVSISDYLYINDLEYCDEDAIAWYSFLNNNGYEIYLLGDKTSSYGMYRLNDYATENNIKKYMKLISEKINKNDQFVFISSGHGDGDGKGQSFICCLNCSNSPDGQYTDKELATDVKLFTNKEAKVILFFDNCFSGGLINEVVENNPQLVCATSTCTQDGYGFDVPEYKHGAWTYHFLIKNLLKNSKQTIYDVFTKALVDYPFTDGDLPQLGGNSLLTF
jgi:hypothetical protein